MTVRLYVPGFHASGTMADAEAIAAAAFVGFVFQLRSGGLRLPARRVGEPTAGQVVCIDRYGEEDRFYVRLYRPGQLTDWSHELHGARIIRQAGGCMIIGGDEWTPAANAHQRQTWLCVPTAERNWAILRKMAAASREARIRRCKRACRLPVRAMSRFCRSADLAHALEQARHGRAAAWAHLRAAYETLHHARQLRPALISACMVASVSNQAYNGYMEMDDHSAATGDALSEAIRRAVQALIADDHPGAWKALDNPAVARALRDWDRLRGGRVPSEAELQAEQEALVAELGRAVQQSPGR